MVTLTATPPPPISGDAALTAVPPSPTREAIVPRELGPVVLIRELGRGGMGTVWLARHELLNRPVAVKFILNADERIDPGFCMFLTGARAAAAVRHLGLTSILHADLTEGLPYIVMEYVEGPTLAEVLRKCGPFNSEQAVAAIWQVSDAVAELHEHSIIHRDIKPANVLLDREGKTYVTDFGLACVRRYTAIYGARNVRWPSLAAQRRVCDFCHRL